MRRHIIAAVAAASPTAVAARAAEPGDTGYDPHADAFASFIARWRGYAAHRTSA